mgnify:CR=1 FL=1
MKDKIWQTIKDEVTLRIEAEPSLKPYLETLVISKKSLISSVAAILSSKLNSDALKSSDINDFILDVYENCDGIEDNIVKDLLFFKNHDPACRYFSTPILFLCFIFVILAGQNCFYFLQVMDLYCLSNGLKILEPRWLFPSQDVAESLLV